LPLLYVGVRVGLLGPLMVAKVPLWLAKVSTW
jgi:hypothetical protein